MSNRKRCGECKKIHASNGWHEQEDNSWVAGECLDMYRARQLMAPELASTRAALARAEQYARRLEDEIVFRLHGEVLALAEDDEWREAPELRQAAMTIYTAATERWRDMFAASPLTAATSSPAPAQVGAE